MAFVRPDPIPLSEIRRRFRLVWTPLESGGIFLEERMPLGKRLMGLFRSEAASVARAELVAAVVRDFLRSGELAAGSYEVLNYHNEGMVTSIQLDAYGSPRIELPAGERLRVNFTSEHRALLRHANAREWEGQVELMDPKRPYGNMSYFFLDMAHALGEEVLREARGKTRVSDAQASRFSRLHGEMLLAAQAYWEHAKA